MTIDFELQRRAARLVEREVHACVSSLVDTLSGADYEHGADKLGELMDQACHLADYVLDYESAAREAGAKLHHREDDGHWCVLDQFENDLWDALFTTENEAARAYCEQHDIEPHEIEVYEHWAVSSWLADKLEAKGERVDRDFAGLIVWARTTTGQAISIDSVIEAIVSETGYASGGEA